MSVAPKRRRGAAGQPPDRPRCAPCDRGTPAVHGGRPRCAPCNRGTPAVHGGRPRFRGTPRPADVEAIRELAARAGVFGRAERVVAVELLQERLQNGRRSGYHFTFADVGGAPIGYAAWGPVPLTVHSYDLYWIIVDPSFQGAGVGRELLERAERAVAGRGGRQLYIETSSREQYARTRRFYRRAGYREAARLADFYAPGDAKVIFCKALAPPARPAVRRGFK